MQIHLTTRNIERPERYREAVARATRLALARYAERVNRVVVTLADVNGPRGGRDKRCTIELVALPGHRPVVVSADDTTVRGALGRATERAVRATGRRIDAARHRARRGRAAGQGPRATRGAGGR